MKKTKLGETKFGTGKSEEDKLKTPYANPKAPYSKQRNDKKYKTKMKGGL